MNENKQIEEMVSIINSADPHYICKNQKCSTCEWFFVKKLCYSAKALYNAGYRKQEWISVEDDSPKENGIYCVMVETYKSRKCKERTHARYKNGRWLDLYDDWENRCWRVTHWMPLPTQLDGGEK